MSDEEGRITQANKVYSHTEKYEENLKAHDIDYVKLEHHSLISTDKWMVNKDKNFDGLVRRRPMMPVSYDKLVIKAGGVDSAIIRTPKKVACNIRGAQSEIWDFMLDDGELELAIPLPMIYTVRLQKWPYIDRVLNVEGVA